MSGFHFSKVLKFKIRRGGEGVVEDISPLPPVSSVASNPGATVLQMLEVTTDNSSYIPPALEKASAKSEEEAFRVPTSPPPSKYEYINIGSHCDELDPTVLGKLPPSAANAAASVHKYWTSAFGKVADNAKLTELLKLAEMYTSRSHVFNCELYKLLEMKVDELCSVTGRDEDVEALRAENKDLRGRLAFSENVRARATYDVMKAQTIQKACVDA
ncbi:hypothetical protein Fot_05517 [Forsythia ovata]|uniref:Uncharacterized protein n=1 Tax=Forsythia ovata TaxID=205694 RepID=A0ABD1WT85_9LAMI